MKKTNLLLSLLLISISFPSFAQYGEKSQVELGAFGGYVFTGDYPIEPKNAFFGGIRLGYWLTDSFSAEVSGQRAFSEDITGGRSLDLDAYRLNLLWNFAPQKRFRPFVTVGAGLEGFDFPVVGQEYSVGYNGGLGLRSFITDRAGLRLEGRFIYLNADYLPRGDYVYNIEAQLGFFYLFGKGKKKEAPAPVVAPAPAPAPEPAPVDGDSDGDGVLDSKDKCENTAKDVKVDETGCPPEVVKKARGALKGVNFLFGKAELTDASKKILDEVAVALKEVTDGKIEVQGHTDNIGGADINLKMSQARAQAVADYLMEKDVDEKRLTWKGYGDSSPIADNKTSAGRSQNRRVELKWLD